MLIINFYSIPVLNNVFLDVFWFVYKIYFFPEQNQELKNILCNRHLRDMLSAIDSSSNPAAAMQHAMLEPIFVEFADECLKVIEPVKDSEHI